MGMQTVAMAAITGQQAVVLIACEALSVHSSAFVLPVPPLHVL